MVNSQKGSLSIIVVLLLLVGIGFGVFLVSQKTTYFSKADSVDCNSPRNDIVAENCKIGVDKSEWDLKFNMNSQGYTTVGNPTIQGFASKISYQRGETVEFKVKITKKDITESTPPTNPNDFGTRTPDPNRSSYMEDAVGVPFHINVYRLGYYSGKGARLVGKLNNLTSVDQPDCIFEQSSLNFDCGIWLTSATWQIPTVGPSDDPTLGLSGVYIAKLIKDDNISLLEKDRPANHIVFIVREHEEISQSKASDILFQTSDTTWQTYNTYPYYGVEKNADNSSPLPSPSMIPNSDAIIPESPKKKEYIPGYSQYTIAYGWSPAPNGIKVSYNRPFNNRNYGPGSGNSRDSFVFGDTYPMIRFLEQNGYSVSYITGWDVHRLPQSILQKHKAFLSVGHDEYWSFDQRKKVEAARDAGLNLGFFSGNLMYWQIGYENSIDGKNTPQQTLVARKEKCYGSSQQSSWTGTFRDPGICRPATDPVNPENSLTGTLFRVVNQPVDRSINKPELDFMTDFIEVKGDDAKLRLWRNTDLRTDTTNVLKRNSLGYEWDIDPDNGYRPAGLFRLSDTLVNAHALSSEDASPAPRVMRHNLVMYKKNGLVFGSGTIQWSWLLDINHDYEDVPLREKNTDVDKNIQQATVNILADFGAQPQSLISTLKSASKTTDTLAPSSTIVSPKNNAGVGKQSLTISGTAADSGGGDRLGKVGGIEISTDNGQTWHPAEGRENWTYKWTPLSKGKYNIKSRAVDDSGNIENVSAGIVINVGEPNTQISAGPCTTPSPIGSDYCQSAISWSSTGYSNVQVWVIDGNDVAQFGAATSHSGLNAPWISPTGMTFELRSGSTVLNSTFVKYDKTQASPPPSSPPSPSPTSSSSPLGLITASPNPCFIISGQSSCTSNIKITANLPKMQIKLRGVKDSNGNESPFTGVGAQVNSNYPANWINTTGYTFDLYSDGILKDYVTVKASPPPVISVSPSPCTLGSDGYCPPVTITLNAPGKTSLQIKAFRTDGTFAGDITGVGADPLGSTTFKYVDTKGYNIKLYSGTSELGSVFVKGN